MHFTKNANKLLMRNESEIKNFRHWIVGTIQVQDGALLLMAHFMN